MHWVIGILSLAGFLSLVSCQDDSESTSVVDPVTGFTFASYTSDASITYRTAVSTSVPAPDTAWDVVLQVIAPTTIGWTGLAWGGAMTYNPLSLVWANGPGAVVSSRQAIGYFQPDPYTGASYTILPGGTSVNATHYTLTALCTGCTRWGDDEVGYTTLDLTAQALLAFAYSAKPVSEPANNASSFSIHDNVGRWIHNFAQGTNGDFDALVAGLSSNSTSFLRSRKWGRRRL